MSLVTLELKCNKNCFITDNTKEILLNLTKNVFKIQGGICDWELHLKPYSSGQRKYFQWFTRPTHFTVVGADARGTAVSQLISLMTIITNLVTDD